ncbi:TetR/AcrR family transcriptional regulator [Prauserella rugosa]|uniref:TetR family transcriptional regulator n=1 Tax=Prauserella rugosa TaxID=43354 RepID=A0A660CAK4_9PSEU|nr:TetR/AcrR family transcriptional regulator [Prauserella rugosa]KID29802.1 transcriptional regulator, TetR family [Prauserella sp. Am3]KMS84382.1 TetR family transcriptional regulator [Streptomyces regensis]TWH18907.1 TetR family transcriptional regulator [Prauserella rugosa]
MTAGSAPKWRRLEPDQRREQIFACAAELFGERPYAAVSTADIAARAGVARGLINHYFGTKRELYLSVVRRALTLPPSAVATLPDGPLAERTDAAVDWFLDMVSKQQKTWLAAITPEGIGRDDEVERILDEADREAATLVLEAMGFDRSDARWEQLVAVIRTYAGMVKAASREWLDRETLNRDQVHTVLSQVLLTLVSDVIPRARQQAASDS